MYISQHLKLINTIPRPDINSVLEVYSHRSGAQIVRIANEDPEKMFCATFRTSVSDSTGVPHILEHSLLAGSKKYPVADPFVVLLKTSMPTFLNAMTYPDKTMYPVGSANFRDFMNLSDVYMDTCFNPLLTKETFEREGWRYEFNNEGKLTFQGVVFNEMKGVYSNTERYVIDDGLLSEIYPDNEYNHISGGNPENITDLSYEQFIAFYKKNYHPANSLIAVYGKMTQDEENEFMTSLEDYLCDYDASTIQPIVTKSADYLQRSVVNKTYQSSPADTNLYTNVVYRFDTTITGTTMSLIIDYFLTDSRDCYKEIMATGLVERFVSIGVENDLYQPYLAISAEIKTAEGSTVIQSVFEKHVNLVIEKGIDLELLKGLINQMEFAYIESLDHNGFGIINELSRRFGKDEEFLAIDYYAILEDVKRVVLDENLLSQFLKHNIIDNVNSKIVQFQPDTEFTAKIIQKEKSKLAIIQSELSQEQIDEINTKAEIIKKGVIEDESVIPRLEVSDIPTKLNFKELVIVDNTKYSLIYIPQIQKKTTLLNISFKLKSDFEKSNLHYLDLLFSKLFNFATLNHSENDLEITLKQNLGGYGSNINMKIDGSIAGSVSASYLPDKQSKVLDLLTEILGKRNFDSPALIKNLVDSSLSNIQYVIKNESEEIISEKLNISMLDTIYYEHYSLAAQEEFLKSSQLQIKENYTTFVSRLEDAYDEFLDSLELSISYLGDYSKIDSVTEFCDKISESLNTSTYKPTKTDYKFKDYTNELIAYQSSEIVNYHRQTASLGSIKPNIGAMYLMSRISTFEYGWIEVRSKGGAYGVRMRYNEANNTFGATTFRDPRNEENQNLLKDALIYLSNFSLTDQAFESFKVATINSFMPYRNPESEFYMYISNYYSGRTDNSKLQLIYTQILNSTQEEIKAIAKQILDECVIARAVSLKIKS